MNIETNLGFISYKNRKMISFSVVNREKSIRKVCLLFYKRKLLRFGEVDIGRDAY